MIRKPTYFADVSGVTGCVDETGYHVAIFTEARGSGVAHLRWGAEALK